MARRLASERDVLEMRCQQQVVLGGVAVRDPKRERGVDLSGITVTDDARALAGAESIDVFIEVMGGIKLARELVETALKTGKHVITANKQLMAECGEDLSKLADREKRCLRFSAAVGGGVPIVEYLQDSLRGESLSDLYAVLNGTTSLILDSIAHGHSFDDALADAQQKGWAEADPADDVDGLDAAAKLAICASLAWNSVFHRSDVAIAGVRDVDATDVAIADSFGYGVALLGRAHQDRGSVWMSVGPTVIPRTGHLASPVTALGVGGGGLVTSGPLNTPTTLTGMGAGARPTTSAVLSDLYAVAQGWTSAWKITDSLKTGSFGTRETGAYLRLRHNQLAEAEDVIVQLLRDRGVGVNISATTATDQVVVVSGEVTVDNIDAAIATLDSVHDVSVIARMDAVA